MADRFPCPSCGAELSWSPGQGDLTCPYCEYVHQDTSGAAQSAGDADFQPKEYDLTKAAIVATQGWGAEVKEMRCETCGAVSEVEPHIAATSCPFCDSDALSQVDDVGELIRPESVLPFKVDKNGAGGKFREWLGGLWFRPSALKSMAQMGDINGMYLPVWTYDASTRSQWTAEAGHYYYVDETYTDSDGNRQTRKVRKTRWVPASGRHSKAFDDVLVVASKGLEQNLFKGLFPFDLSQLAPYDTKYLAGFTAERYQIDLQDGYKTAQKEMEETIRSECARSVPGDTHRNLSVRTSWNDVTFKHVLLPVWIAAYRYQDKAYRFIVNGQTGEANGTAPYSPWKIAGAVIGALALIGTCMGILSASGG